MKGLNPGLSGEEQWDQIAPFTQPPALCTRHRGAWVVGVHRDESFQGRDKGSALGKILHYCGFQYNGLAEDLTRWNGRVQAPRHRPLHRHAHSDLLAVSVQSWYFCVRPCVLSTVVKRNKVHLRKWHAIYQYQYITGVFLFSTQRQTGGFYFLQNLNKLLC